MHDITIEEGTEVVVTNNDTIEVDVGLDNVTVTTENSGQLDVEPNEYFLTSSGIYTGQVTNGVPQWIQNAIRQELTVGDGNITNVIDDLRRYITTVENGVNQNVTQIETANQNLAAVEESIVSRLDDNSAAIYNLDTTKVTSTEAQTIALSLQESTFGKDVDAYITNLAATYTDENSAVAQNVDLLVASVNGIQSSVSQNSEAVVDKYENPDWVDDGVQTDPDTNEEPRWIYEARAKHSLEVNADGNIAGFVAEADGTKSRFNILADEFTVASGATKLPVFVVDTTPGEEYVTFNSNVRIDGSCLAENTITANKINTVGLIAEDIYTTELYGKYIEGANIVGSVIKSSWIDSTTTGDLTNWQFYGDIGNTEEHPEYPIAYEANFAHDNQTGDIIVDTLGYVRLPGSSTLYSSSYSFSLSIGESNTATDEVCAYDEYTIGTVKRCVHQRPYLNSTESNILNMTSPTYMFFPGDGSNILNFVIGGKNIVMKVSGAPYETWWTMGAIVIVDGTIVVGIQANSHSKPSRSEVFSVYGINFRLYNIMSTAYLAIFVQAAQQLDIHSNKSYIIGNFSRPSNSGPGDINITMPSIKYT